LGEIMAERIASPPVTDYYFILKICVPKAIFHLLFI